MGGEATVDEIRNAVSAEFEPVSIEEVVRHFEILEAAEVISFKN